MVNKYFIFILVICSFSSQALGTSSFEVFSNLEGIWRVKIGDKLTKTKMVYALSSKNSIVTEYFGKELSVFSQDGKRLVMTHFCNSGHQSRLMLKKSDSSKVFEFISFDLLNLKNHDDSHVGRVVYKIRTKSEIELNIIWIRGKSENVESYTLIRL